jgi:hypothetical protein
MLGRILYGGFFVLVLPTLLAVWSWRLEPLISLPAVRNASAGVVLLGQGIAFMVSGMVALWFYGGGLPMNAFPPPRLVEQGIYRYFSQPIYIGFVAACAGLALATGSRAGFWVVTPLVAAGAAALVCGYEHHDLRRRFGRLPCPLINIPADSPGAPTAWERASVYLLLYLPWLILYEAIGHIQPGDVHDVTFAFERSWPVLPWTELIYAATYPFVLFVPIAVTTRNVLRRYTLAGLSATGFGCLAYLALPVVAPPRPFDDTGFLADMLRLERADSLNGYAACPSFHVAHTFLAAWAYAQSWPRWRWACWLAAVALSLSCLTTGMHALVDIPAGFALFAFAIAAPGLWTRILSVAEVIANSWSERRYGPIRVINYSVYAGLAAWVGIAGSGLLAGRENFGAIAGVSVCALVGAGLWGQLLVGSAALLRPFGYYGAVVGGAVGLGIVAVLDYDVWTIAGALAVMAPWVQLAGRFRCLVQGCCHGAPTGTDWGIRYRAPQSRVCRIAKLTNVAVHPTPVYSMLGNVAIGIVLGRMWSAGAPLPMIGGLYLVLAGLARFVEESYRGEPQTQIVAKLHIYQWFAICSVVAGMILMTFSTASHPRPVEFNWQVPVFSLPLAALYWFAMGVDFPESQRRFSRLV